MSLWSRVANVFRADRVDREIAEELESHINEAIAEGRDSAEAREAFGSAIRHSEESRDIRVAAWLDALRADAIFGWRQLNKRKVTSAAAILSLGLAMGACTSAFRLVDALLLRPLPIKDPGQLYVLSRQGTGVDGKANTYDTWAYPAFRLMRSAVSGQAELIAISSADRRDLSYAPEQEVEKAQVQFVSGWMFDSFGLRPASGRMFTENDDLTPGAHPVAVLSHDYWARRFGQDPKSIGRNFRMGDDLYEIVGIAPESFTGTEPGTITDIFVPTMMRGASVSRSDSYWFRTFVRLKPGVKGEPVRAKLDATSRAFEAERAKGFAGWSKDQINRNLDQELLMESASAGVSGLSKDYRLPLTALGVLVCLVLLIACANVANLMTAQAASRAREMALRVSIGAGRVRLVQLVLTESAILSLLATALGGVFAWWSVPVVAGMIHTPDIPARLILPADWRVLGFGLALALAVTVLFGLTPAIHASAVKPAGALRGGDDPHMRRRLMRGLVAAQVAFCFVVLFTSGLFLASFERLSNVPTGFSAQGVLTLDTVTAQAQPSSSWEQVAAHLRSLPGIETVALAGWPLLSGTQSNNLIAVNGEPSTHVPVFFLSVSPGWIGAMRIPLVNGRDFRPSDVDPGDAIVNETFAKQFFNGANPVGKSFQKTTGTIHSPIQIVGIVKDALYQDLREKPKAVAYVPFASEDAAGVFQKKREATFIVRTSASSPLSMARLLRREVTRAGLGFRVSNIRTQEELVRAQSVRERLLASIALFFAIVALLLAGIGLYGVLDYSVLQRRREIGIRMAIGAQPAGIARLVTAHVLYMVATGAAAGLALGLASVRYIESLMYQVKGGDMRMLALPSLALLATALIAALPAVHRAVHVDPVEALRSE